MRASTQLTIRQRKRKPCALGFNSVLNPKLEKIGEVKEGSMPLFVHSPMQRNCHGVVQVQQWCSCWWWWSELCFRDSSNSNSGSRWIGSLDRVEEEGKDELQRFLQMCLCSRYSTHLLLYHLYHHHHHHCFWYFVYDIPEKRTNVIYNVCTQSDDDHDYHVVCVCVLSFLPFFTFHAFLISCFLFPLSFLWILKLQRIIFPCVPFYFP